jgi:ribosomal protein L29
MKQNDLKTKTKTELERSLQELRSRLAQFRFDLADKKLKRTSDVRETRHEIARMLTALKTAK